MTMNQIHTILCALVVAFMLLSGPPAGYAGEMDVNQLPAPRSNAASGDSNEVKPNTGGLTARPKLAAGTYVVRTIWKGAPIPKVRVEWRHRVDDPLPHLSKQTIRFGTAQFQPPSGSYILTADWRPDGDYTRPRRPGDRFAWLGGNPLLVSSEIGGEITLVLEEVPQPLAPHVVPATGSGIVGRVMQGRLAVADAGVYAYASTDSAFKGNDFEALVRTNSSGEFTLPLPPGKYYLLARLRADNSVDLGPLHKGDLLGYAPQNPLVVEQGHFTTSIVPVVPLKMLRSLAESSAIKPVIIDGQIVDRSGQPMTGVYAALYGNPNMVDRPSFRSEPTGPDGRFQLTVLVPGEYFLAARTGYGGAPPSGGWFGKWSEKTGPAISVKTGTDRTEIKIVVDRIQ
jgi:hypothetical protein